MPVKVMTDVSEFESMRERWNELVDTSAYPNIFTTWEWSFLWWKYFGQTIGKRDGTLFILLVESDAPEGELLAIFPLYRTGNGRFLYWIGFGARPCAEYLGPIIRRDAIDVAVQSVCDFLVNDAGRWDCLFFEDYALDDPGTSAFADCLKQKFPSQTKLGELRYFIALPDSYDAYLKTLGKHNRDNKKNRLNKSRSTYQATSEVIPVDELERGFSILLNLTTESRQRLKQTSPYLLENYRDFHREILETLLPMNRALIFLLKYSDQPVGILYCYLLKNKCYAHQHGCVSDQTGSPGDVTIQNMMIHLIDNHFAEFDFLRGSQWYKSSYTETTRETEMLSIYRNKNAVFHRDRMIEQLFKPLKRALKYLVKKLFIRKP